MDTLKSSRTYSKFSIEIALIYIVFIASIGRAQGNYDIKSNIAIPFSLNEGGYVTLVIENKEGLRVRNLVSEAWFNSGKNVVYWDGLDDLGRDADAAMHGVYSVPGKFVESGEYSVHGIVHSKIIPTYEFSIYNPGTPAWRNHSGTGGWLANHTPPQAALFMPANRSPTGEPAIYLGSYVTEGPDALIWTDLNGKKIGGKKWLGGVWTGAPYLARDMGSKADVKMFAYAGSIWFQNNEKTMLELRVTGINAGKDKQVVKYTIGAINPDLDDKKEMGGFAIYNNKGVVSLRNQLFILDLKDGTVEKKIAVNSPKGLAYNDKGQLYVISGTKVIIYDNVNSAAAKSPKTIIDDKLEEPVGIALDAKGNIYISDKGNSHQVKIFNANGQFIRAIGKPGKPEAGPYDPLHMNNPEGITVDSKEQLWVTENDFLPKRVSVWSLTGDLLKTFYGPSKYGGGGTVDPQDKNKLYYAESSKGAMEFALDWKSGKNTLKNILYREGPHELKLPVHAAAPETAIYHKGQRFFTNCYNSDPTSGTDIAFIFTERDGKVFPAAAMGNAVKWSLLLEDKYKSLWPEKSLNKVTKKPGKISTFFIWCDLNGDAFVQPSEITFQTGKVSGVTVQEDLSYCLSFNGQATQFKPEGFTKYNTPLYKIDKPLILAKGLSGRASSGGDQTLTTRDGWTVTTQGIANYSKFSISGAKDGKAVWSYPNMWPGLHASHYAPIPDFNGELIGTTRLLGGFFNTSKDGRDALWAVNGNHGTVYIFTADGLFVTTLFKPVRNGVRWNMEKAIRGMAIDTLTLSEENFWPSITQTSDGNVYLQDGHRSSIVKIDGLQTLERLRPIKVTVTQKDINNISENLRKAQLPVAKPGDNIMTVVTNKKITVDGNPLEWADSNWADIDKRGVNAYFNSAHKSYNVTGAVAVNSGKLYAAFRTGDSKLLTNTGEIESAPFKTGGALDIMIRTNGDSKSTSAANGDVRILITLVKNKPYALLYRQVATGAKQAEKVPFSSPQRTITFDKVEDISTQIEFAASKDGDYEISVPLSLLKLTPKKGMSIKGDIGILRGDGEQTIARVYWSNKATGIISDVPSEAELTPSHWGVWKFE